MLYYSEKKVQKTKLNANQVCYDEKCLKKNKLHTNIVKTEEDIKVFVSLCQQIYDDEIAEVSYMLISFIDTSIALNYNVRFICNIFIIIMNIILFQEHKLRKSGERN